MVYRSSSAVGQSTDGRGGLWSGELTKNAAAGFGYSEKQVTISLDSGSAVTDVKPVKELPIWLSHSTVTDTALLADRQQLQQQQLLLQVTATTTVVSQSKYLGY